LKWMRSRIGFPRIVLFLDRDGAGRKGARQALERLRQHNFDVSLFDWDRDMWGNAQGSEQSPDSMQDPADMSVEQIQCLRRQDFI